MRPFPFFASRRTRVAITSVTTAFALVVTSFGTLSAQPPATVKPGSQPASKPVALPAPTAKPITQPPVAKPAVAVGNKAAPAAAPAKSPTAAPQVDINHATLKQLKAIPGIGDAYAAKIIKGRPYANKTQLVSRNIINASLFETIQGMIIAKQ